MRVSCVCVSEKKKGHYYVVLAFFVVVFVLVALMTSSSLIKVLKLKLFLLSFDSSLFC